MMKEDIKVVHYNKIDKDFEGLIELHQLIYKETELKECLIYFDHNFSNFFAKVLENENDFVSILKVNGELAGFIHFKYFDNTLFLNNICIGNSYQKRGYGSLLLKESLSLISLSRFSFFELDVFLSNQKALKWYETLGLKEVKYSNWYQIFQKVKLQTCAKLNVDLDINGFQSIFHKNLKIATKVKNNVIIHDLNYLSMLPFDMFNKIITVNSNFIINDDFNYVILEKSVRMRVTLKNLLNKLN